MLTQYQQETQRLLHDPSAVYFSTTDLTAYINTARNQVALEGQCVRQLVCGVITSVAVVSGGSGYSLQTLISVSGNGMGAVITPAINTGVITSATIVAGGTSYDTTANTQLTVIDPSNSPGSGASLTAVLAGANLTTVGQEIYPFSSVNAAAQALNPGINQILGVMSVAVSWGAMKPMLDKRTWTDFQAHFRAWTTGFQGQPAVWAQYGQGVNGSIYICPIPSQVLNMDWDTYCAPIALVTDSTVEAIPYPWTDCVQYYAAFLAYANSQRQSDAEAMMKLYTMNVKRARAMSEGTFIPSPYW